MPHYYTNTKNTAEAIVRTEAQSQVYPDHDTFVDRVIEVKILLDGIARRNGLDPQFLTVDDERRIKGLYAKVGAPA